MNRLVVTLVALSASIVGCANAADQQQKADVAQSNANAKMTAVNADATAKNKATQAEADVKVAEAQAAFAKIKEDYRHTMNENLTKLDQSVANLEASAKAAKGKDKTDREASLVTIHNARTQFGTDYKVLDQTNASDWDAAKVKIEEKWTNLKTLVDKGA